MFHERNIEKLEKNAYFSRNEHFSLPAQSFLAAPIASLYIFCVCANRGHLMMEYLAEWY